MLASLAAIIIPSMGAMRFELEAYTPIADPDAIIITGNARFTVLSPRLIRMEYASASGAFEDRPTLAFVNRKQPVPAFKWEPGTTSGGVLTTNSIVLTYTGGPFKADSLFVKPAASASPTSFTGWKFGMTSDDDAGNLRGTIRTLDRTNNISLNCNGDDMHERHCTWGVVSRSGWAVVNETGVPCLDEDDWWADGAGRMLRNVDTHDLYLFAHGHDYRGAIADLTAVGGKVPLIPRRNFGVWFTRWYDYDAQDVREILGDFEQRGLPLDVLVLDMNWHTKDDWTGYSWDKTLFDEPKDLLSWVHGAGVSVAANLHDADGVRSYEAQHASMVTAMGLPKSTGDLRFTCTNQSYLYALEDVMLRAVEDDGMDFWWIDWQQGESEGNTGQDGRPDQKMNPVRSFHSNPRVQRMLRFHEASLCVRASPCMPSCVLCLMCATDDLDCQGTRHRLDAPLRSRSWLHQQAWSYLCALGRPRPTSVPAWLLGRRRPDLMGQSRVPGVLQCDGEQRCLWVLVTRHYRLG